MDLEIQSPEEAGGQFFRLILSLLGVIFLSGVRKLNLVNIRPTRPVPGLHAQGLAGIASINSIFPSITFDGAVLGSPSLTIKLPGEYILETVAEEPRNIVIDIGTAGSVCLVLQTLLGILPQGILVSVIGGTNVDFAPPTDHVELVLIPVLAMWGIKLVYNTLTRGVYPKGGGQVEFSINRDDIKPFRLIQRGKITRVIIRVVSSVIGLDINQFLDAFKVSVPEGAESVIEEQVIQDTNMRNKTQICVVIETNTGCRLSDSVILQNVKEKLPSNSSQVQELFQRLTQLLESSATFDEHTADQVLLPMALAAIAAETGTGCDGVSAIRVAKVEGVSHITSAMAVIQQLLPNVQFSVEASDKGSFIITCQPFTK